MSESESPASARSGILLQVAYDGRDFAGWQKQPGQRTVQGVLEEAIASMNGAHADLRGASRTDAGVHAEGQRAAFNASKGIEPRGWMLGLNTRLPSDVSVLAAEPCAIDYAPRFDTVDKTYRYLVLFGEPRHPLWRDRAWHLSYAQLSDAKTGRGSPKINLASIRDSIPILLGTHDFSAFRAADDERINTMRTLLKLDVIEGFGGVDELLAFEFTGSAFMKQMVRILVGTLIEIGRGKITHEQLHALLQPGAKREHAGPTAAAHGLTLLRVRLGRGQDDASLER